MSGSQSKPGRKKVLDPSGGWHLVRHIIAPRYPDVTFESLDNRQKKYQTEKFRELLLEPIELWQGSKEEWSSLSALDRAKYYLVQEEARRLSKEEGNANRSLQAIMIDMIMNVENTNGPTTSSANESEIVGNPLHTDAPNSESHAMESEILLVHQLQQGLMEITPPTHSITNMKMKT
jgi:hypothetical protein